MGTYQPISDISLGLIRKSLELNINIYIRSQTVFYFEGLIWSIPFTILVFSFFVRISTSL